MEITEKYLQENLSIKAEKKEIYQGICGDEDGNLYKKEITIKLLLGDLVISEDTIKL